MKRSTSPPTAPETMSRLCPSGTSACAVMPSTTVSSTRTTPSFGPGRRPRARLSPTGSAGDDAQRRLAPPPRFALLPELAAGAHHPAPHPGRCRAYVPPGSRAPARRGGPPRRPRSSCAFSVCSTRTPPRLCPTKGRDARRASRVRSARNARDVAFERAAASIGEDVRHIARPRQARGEQRHRHRRHPQPGASTIARH